MNNELSVRLNGVEIGTLFLINGKMEFKYNPKAKFPISLSLPLQKETFKEKACRAYFGGLLPENPNMRDLLSKKYKISINNDFKLLEAIGHDCAGAISFHQKDEPEIFQDFIKIKGKILSDAELKKYIKELPYKPYMGNRISLAGAQEKTAVCVIKGKIAIPDDNIPTTHIIKTALPKYIQSIQNEYICMELAKKIGIETPKVEIKKTDDTEFLIIERFDRKFKNNYIKRILQEDFAQSLSVQSRDKYKVTFRDCLCVLNQTKRPAISKKEFLKRVIFNYLIGNTDAHAKNFSILFDENNIINLTPAYDLLCSSVYDCDQRIAMKIGKAKYYNDVKEEDWKIFSKEIDVSYKILEQELTRQKNLIIPFLTEITDDLNCKIGYEILKYVKSKL